jgi:hypothetical protein
MDKNNKVESKPSYFYIKQTTLEQFFGAFKTSSILIFWMSLFIIPFGIFFDDPRNSQSMLGLPNFIWYLIFFAIASWLYKGNKIDIQIPKLTFLEWLMVNFLVTTLTLSHLFADRWFDIFYFLFLFFLVSLYLNLLAIGKENEMK